MEAIDIIIARKLAAILNKYLSYRRRPRTKTWEDNFAGGQTHFLHEIGNGIRIGLYQDSELAKLIYASFEDKEQGFISRLVRPGDIFFDIGANIGLHSLLACHAMKGRGEVYAFEPAPKTYGRLLGNIGLNGWQDMVRAFNLGMSDQEGELLLNVSENGYDAWNSFADLRHVSFDHQSKVKVTTVADFIRQNGISGKKISLIKIDVEGWELKVLSGFGKLFDNSDFQPAFLIEFTEENAFRAGYTCRDIYDFMLGKGYEWFDYRLQDDSLDPSPLKAYYPYENLVAVKKGQLDAVKALLSAR